MPDDHDQVIELAAEKLAERLARQMRQLVPDRLYTREEAAELLGLPRVQTLSDFPPEILPSVHITPGGRGVRYYGRDLLRLIRERRAPGAPPLEGVA